MTDYREQRDALEGLELAKALLIKAGLPPIRVNEHVRPLRGLLLAHVGALALDAPVQPHDVVAPPVDLAAGVVNKGGEPVDLVPPEMEVDEAGLRDGPDDPRTVITVELDPPAPAEPFVPVETGRMCKVPECGKPARPRTLPGGPPPSTCEEHELPVNRKRRLAREAAARAKAGLPEPPISAPPSALAGAVADLAFEGDDPGLTLPGGEVLAPPRCGRCDQEGHRVEDCPKPSNWKALEAKRRKAEERAAAEAEAERQKAAKSREAALARSAPAVPKQTASAQDIARLQQRFAGDHAGGTGDAEREEKRRFEKREREARLSARDQMARVWVPPATSEPIPLADVELGRNAMHFREMWAEGLPESRGFYYLPDVLALYGLDEDLVTACLRNPERVEVRPESFDRGKRYVVLGFYRGDIMVVLGLREPTKPCVIAVYADSRLETDTHRVNHHGSSGGSKSGGGLPATVKQSVRRLRMLGCEVELDELHGGSSTPVTYHGEDLGAITVTVGDPPAAPHRTTVENDYQRMLRKVTAIDLAERSRKRATA